MVIETGRPVAEVARGLGIHDGTLGNWVNACWRAHPEPDQPLTPVERARVSELEDEIRRLRMENEFLKAPWSGSRTCPPMVALATVVTVRKIATVVPFDGGPSEQALRTQTVQVVADRDVWTVLAPVTERGEVIGLLELTLPASRSLGRWLRSPGRRTRWRSW
jgi:hypothetical protein